MPGNLQPLDQKFPIVTSDGRPTLYFIKWAQQKQIDISEGITAEQALQIIEQYLADHTLQEGSGISIFPSGNLSDSPTIAAEVQAILDQITTVRGSILFRGVTAWEALAPGTANFVLQTNGAGADPTWVAQSGGGGGGNPWWFNPPLAADFPTSFVSAGSTSAFDDPDVGMVFEYGADSINRRIIAKAVPGGDWWVQFRFEANTPMSSFKLMGAVLIYDTGTASTTRLCWLGARSDSLLTRRSETLGLSFTNETNLVSPLGAGVAWGRINYVSSTSTINLFTSTDGKNWSLYQSGTVTGFMGGAGNIPQYVGVGMGSNTATSGVSLSLSVGHWSQSW